MVFKHKYTYCFCIQNKFNIVTFPKCGCTQICKWASECNGYFDEHSHSYSNSRCSIHENVHACGQANCSFHEGLPTYVVYRFPHERILSYYNSNFHRKKLLYKFVLEVCERKVWDDRDGKYLANGDWPLEYEHHLGDRFSNVMKYDGATIVHLDRLNDLIDDLSMIHGVPALSGKEISNRGTRCWDEYKKVEHFSKEMLEMIMKSYEQEYTLKIDYDT